jgi:uncharacterized DUF497 family protein
MSAATTPAVVLETRGIDMRDAAKVFAGRSATWLDERFDYGELRYQTAGLLRGFVLIAWTQRGDARRVISMRYCHEKEVRKFRRRFPLAFGDEPG